MTKRIHPAARARTLTGATSLLALVGIVSGFQFAANAQEASVADGATTPSGTAVTQAIDPATGQPIAPAEATAPVAEAVPAPVSDPSSAAVSAPAAAPVAVPVPVPVPVAAPVVAPAPVAAPVAAPAPAAPAPVVAPAPAPVNGTTAGSGG
ncbi:MAG: hypothetical protein JJE28_06830 [Actinomycetales bacterium]|nr:hypothetical protein [Actinomycetales bacterium]